MYHYKRYYKRIQYEKVTALIKNNKNSFSVEYSFDVRSRFYRIV